MGILNIRKSISSINWSHLCSDNQIDTQVSILEEYVVFDDKKPVWMKQWLKQPMDEPTNQFIYNKGKRFMFF